MISVDIIQNEMKVKICDRLPVLSSLIFLDFVVEKKKIYIYWQ